MAHGRSGAPRRLRQAAPYRSRYRFTTCEALALRLVVAPAALARIKAKLSADRDPQPLFDSARVTRRGRLAPDRALGPVDIHWSQIMAPTRNSMDANESAVFS
jgi:hypothetical protein